MKCKNVLLCILAILVIVGCSQSGADRFGSKNRGKESQSGKETTITGNIQHFEVAEMVLISEQLTDTATINKQGTFKFSFKIPIGSYFVLRNRDHSVRLFLSPGDDLHLEFDRNDIFNTIQFKGKGAEPNLYLKEKYHQMLQHNISTSHLYEVPEKRFRYMADSIYVIEKIFLDDYVKVHPEMASFFIEQEQASLLYDWGNKLMEYPRLTSQPNAIDKQTYFSFLKKLDVNNPSLLKVYEYKQFLNSYIAWYTDELVKNTHSSNLANHETNLIRLQQTNRLITNEEVKNYLLASIIKEQVKYFGYKNTELLFEVFELNCTDADLKNELLIPFQQYKKLTVTDKAPEVTFVDLTGQTFTLDYFNGSYVYIDVWATWCLPCKRESPHFEELSRKFSGKEIQFVSLSVDEDVREWKEYLSTFGYTRNQFRITNPEDFLNAYLIKTIPRFIIINPQGKIEESDAFRPSEPDLKWLANLPDKKAI
jgi:thiol-disulfide isomerase/thioredoxin